MKNKFSKSWIKSKQPRKQRKFRANAPKHLRKKFLGVCLSKELKAKYSRRNIPVRKNDKVKILRGKLKGKIGKINGVNRTKCKVFIDGIDVIKKDGTKRPIPIDPSNLSILELNLNDRKRVKSLEKKEKGEKKNG